MSTSTVDEMAVPSAVPSDGVTSQVSVSPRMNSASAYIPVDRRTPFTYHRMVDASASPSGSVYPR